MSSDPYVHHDHYPIGDLTFVDGTPLNTVETKDAASAFYGEVAHPTIDDIAIMVDTFWAKIFLANPEESRSNVHLWRMDLRGDYTLLSYRPENAGLVGMLLIILRRTGRPHVRDTPLSERVAAEEVGW
jgi:hypothetical protein